MNFIKELIFRFNYKKMLKKDKFISKEYSGNNFENIGIIFPFSEVEIKDIDRFIDDLNIDFSFKKVMGYVDKDINKKTEVDRDVFYNSNFDYRFRPNSDMVLDFINTDFDLLINFAKNNILIKSLVLSINASFRVGWHHNADCIYDFMVMNKDDYSYDLFMSEVVKYLNKVQFSLTDEK